MQHAAAATSSNPHLDVVLAGLEPFAHGSELYTSVPKHAAYETMERVAAQNTACGLPGVCNVTLGHPCEMRHLPLDCHCNSGVNSQF